MVLAYITGFSALIRLSEAMAIPQINNKIKHSIPVTFLNLLYSRGFYTKKYFSLHTPEGI